MEPFAIQRINTILYCNHFDAVVRFYRDVFRLPVVMQKAWFVEFQLRDGACLSVADAARATLSSARGAGLTLSFEVAELDAVRERLMARGVVVTPIRFIWGARGAYLNDPEGHRIEIWSPSVPAD